VRAGFVEAVLIVVGLAAGYASLSFFSPNHAPLPPPALIGPAALPTATVAPAVTATPVPPTVVNLAVIPTVAASSTPQVLAVATDTPLPETTPTVELASPQSTTSAATPTTVGQTPVAVTPAATPRAPAATPTEVVYVVKSGDTLLHVARLFGVSSDAIIQANGLTDPDHLSEGQRLIIPPG
jgi:LysM repeat protein